MNSNLIKMLIFLTIISGSLIFFSCTENDPVTDEETPPTVPPQTSMQINFNEFPDTNTLASFQKIKLTRNNWGWAAFNVAVWNSLLTLTLAVPVAAFVESFNHTPVLQDDGYWLWSYPVDVGGINHTVKLFGRTVNEGVEWKMWISKDGAYTDFEWFTGTSNLPATEGTWTLNRDPNDPTPFLFIQWHRNPNDNTHDIKFTNIVPNAPENGSYIFAEVSNSTPFNMKYHIFNIVQNNLVEIEWNRTSNEGRVKDALHFNDADWKCWDINLMDINCP